MTPLYFNTIEALRTNFEKIGRGTQQTENIYDKPLHPELKETAAWIQNNRVN